MLSYWMILALVFSCCWSRGLSVVKCRSGPQAIRLLIESEAEITSNLDSLPGHGPSEASLTSAGWCSETLLSAVAPYLQFNFNEVYAVFTGIISGVNDMNVSSYITSLQVEADFLGTGKYYLITNSMQISPGTTNTNLVDATDEKPILFSFDGFAKSIRIRPLTWTSNPPCMRIQILGCLADLETVVVPQEPTQAATEGTVTEGTGLATALPIALVTILVVAVIAIISVTLCYYLSRKNRGNDMTIQLVSNKLCSQDSRKNSLSAEASNVEVIYSNDDHYELIVEQPTSKVKEGDTDSMCGNSAYELTDQGEGAEVTPTTREDFGLARNDSYEALDVRTENLYEQPTSTEKEDDTNSIDDGTLKIINNDLCGQDSKNNSLSVEASNLEVIYSDDDDYEFIAEQPTSKVEEDDTNSMCSNSAYELADQGEGMEATPTMREDFGLTRNDSYEALDMHVDNIYEETTN